VLEEEQAYIVMEYVTGRELSNFCSFDKLLPLHRVVGIVFKCCLALDYAFKQGVIHRDIKPANILVDDEDNVKIMDFGLALNTAKKSESDSTFIMGVGSPAYMSPEQIKGYPLNQKTDLYSLGVVLFHLLTGRLPFRAANTAQLVYKIVNADPPMPSQINPERARSMDNIIRRALEKDLYSRYRNGAEMAQDLSAVRFQVVDDNWVALDTSRLEILKKLEFFQGFEEVELWEVLRISTWREIRRIPCSCARGRGGRLRHHRSRGGRGLGRGSGHLPARRRRGGGRDGLSESGCAAPERHGGHADPDRPIWISTTPPWPWPPRSASSASRKSWWPPPSGAWRPPTTAWPATASRPTSRSLTDKLEIELELEPIEVAAGAGEAGMILKRERSLLSGESQSP
jgi:serine/threonine protein kinase